MLVLAASSLAAAAGASCSSGDEQAAPPAPDSLDAGSGPDSSQVVVDAAVEAPPRADAAPFDGGPLPVVCASKPCATSLVTSATGQTTSTAPRDGFCALLDDGTVACWGGNEYGQLGRGAEGGTADSAKAARVVGLSNVVELDHTCARTDSGDVWCWGQGPYVRNDAGVYATELAPVKIPIPPARSVARGTFVGCAVIDDGLVCWGENVYAQIDQGGAPFARPPTLIDLPPGAPIRDVLVGNATFVVREDGSTLSLGANPPLARLSSLPDGDPHPAPPALGVVSSIDLTTSSGCATVGGIGYCWGAVDIVGLPPEDAPSPLVNALPKPVVAPEPLVGIATTSTAAITDFAGDRIVWPQRWCAVGASGAVYCWGFNSQGQAGDGTKDHAYHAVEVKGLPAPAAEVKTMPLSTCALLTTGKVYCWGSNAYGQLGRGVFGVAEGGSLAPQEVVLP